MRLMEVTLSADRGGIVGLSEKRPQGILDMSTHSIAPLPARQPAVSDGCVVAVRGAVVDFRFAGDQLPAIDDALLILPDDLAPVLAEVQAHLSETTVRALALQSTAGWRRGARVRVCGGPIEAPVGEAVLGRLLDVTGATRADGAALPAPTARRSPRRSSAVRFIVQRRRSPRRPAPLRCFRRASR